VVFTLSDVLHLVSSIQSLRASGWCEHPFDFGLGFHTQSSDFFSLGITASLGVPFHAGAPQDFSVIVLGGGTHAERTNPGASGGGCFATFA
jgi:hypothetical protein